MSAIFFCSDLHFFHSKVVEYCNRPWTAEEQTEELIRRWNSRVSNEDVVYSLGDFAFAKDSQYGKVVDIIEQLNGTITFIKGNHCQKRLWDKINSLNLPNVKRICDYQEVTIDKTKICMSHFPMVIWNRAQYGSWHLFGHVHGSYEGKGKSLDCGIDNHPDYQLFSYEEVRDYMKDRVFEQVSHHKGDL